METEKDLEQPIEINKRKAYLYKARKRFLTIGAKLEEAGGRAWKGSAAGAVFMIILFAALFGIGLETGLGDAVDFLVVFVPGIALALLSPYILLPFVLLLKKLPNKFIAAVASSVILLIILFSQVRSTYQILPLSYVIAGVGIVGGGAIGFWWNSPRKKVSALLALSLGMLCMTGFIIWLAAPGVDRYPAAAVQPVPKELKAENPSLPGSFKVHSFTYGSGTDKRRPHFAEGADYRTNTLNSSMVVSGWNKPRTWFWGFDRTEVPLNGSVWMPEGEGTFPIVVMVHGNHAMEEFSDSGYSYLGELLASRGYIAVSIDENFLNTSSWSGGLNNEISARAWLMLKHLDQLKEFNESEDNVLHEKVDFNNIALLGHSRGGQAAALAAEYNKLERYPNNGMLTFHFDYDIKSVVAIAPTDYFKLGDKPVQLENINYLLLHGSYDSDVSEFSGDRQYNDITFTDGKDWMKASLYIHGANHGQFNTVWGDNDTSFPMNLLINKKPLLEGEEQRQAAKTYISAFLDTTLKGKKEYVPMFRDYSYAHDWLPDTVYVSRYSDSGYMAFNDFENDYDLTTGTQEGFEFKASRLRMWNEGELDYREGEGRQNSGVYLKWDGSYSQHGNYEVSLPEGYFAGEKITTEDSFVFSAGNLKDESTGFSVRLEGENGESADFSIGEWVPLAPALHIQHSKTHFYQKARYGDTHEPVLQTFSIPFEEMLKDNKELRLSQVKKIAFVFNKSSDGHIFLDDIGINKADN